MIMAAARPTTPDLLAWPAMKAAADRLEAAEAARVRAARRYQYAPHGEKESRLRALQEATQEALAAQLALAAIEGWG